MELEFGHIVDVELDCFFYLVEVVVELMTKADDFVVGDQEFISFEFVADVGFGFFEAPFVLWI